MSSTNQIHDVSGEMSEWASGNPPRWYALHTRARHEKTVERRLREQGMETFLPVSHELHTWSDRKKKVEVPLFNCYVFVRCSLSAQDRMRVYQVDSVHGFVGVRGAGMPIPDEQIEAIRAVLAQMKPWRAPLPVCPRGKTPSNPDPARSRRWDTGATAAASARADARRPRRAPGRTAGRSCESCHRWENAPTPAWHARRDPLATIHSGQNVARPPPPTSGRP